MTTFTRNRLQSGRRLLGLVALVGLLASSVDAGPGHKKKKRPKVKADVPQLVADNQSVDFIAVTIAEDTQVVEGQAVPKENFTRYADELAEVLATFTPAQQQKIIYGQ